MQLSQPYASCDEREPGAMNVDQTRDLQIFSLTLSQLSYPHNQ